MVVQRDSLVPRNTFQYKVRSRNGQILEGMLTGASQPSVTQRLQAQGYTVLAVEALAQPSLWKRLREPTGRVPAATLAMFCRQFAVMLASGMSVVDAMRIVGELVRDSRLKNGLESARMDVLSGSSLSAAMASYPRAFPPMITQMVEAGEATGALNEVMERLAVYYEREAETRSKIKEALTYPTVVAVAAVLAVNVLVFFVLPNFVAFFNSMDMTLPWMTRILLDGSVFLLRWWWLFMLILLVTVIVIKQWVQSPQGRATKDRWILYAPLIGPVASKYVFSRMSRSLALLVRSGVPMVEALRITEKLVMNVPIARAIGRTRTSVERGSTLGAAMTKETLFPRMLVQMVRVGEESGSMDTTLDHLSEFYDREAGYAVKGLMTLIEPAVIVLMTGVVLFLALAVVVPMFQMSTSMPGA